MSWGLDTGAWTRRAPNRGEQENEGDYASQPAERIRLVDTRSALTNPLGLETRRGSRDMDR